MNQNGAAVIFKDETKEFCSNRSFEFFGLSKLVTHKIEK